MTDNKQLTSVKKIQNTYLVITDIPDCLPFSKRLSLIFFIQECPEISCEDDTVRSFTLSIFYLRTFYGNNCYFGI